MPGVTQSFTTVWSRRPGEW